MAISLKDPETDRLAREVAALTGESLTEAIRTALAERLGRERRRRASSRAGLAQRLKALGRDCAALPDFNTGSADEIIGYDDLGVPR
ncbi:MAG: type II toxin-antitoxin system VapB family antitoxin [Rhodospirillales bacterium]|nr:type II toxin-antitoxin system VapB family antitoxin [Rhodospirillales bacterium]